MTSFKTLICSAALALPMAAMAINPRQYPDTFLIPERAVVLSGNKEAGSNLVAVLYNQEDMHFNEPNCPRFLFLDREGKIALGIGGYAKATFQYDFDGSIDQGASFAPYGIPVPNRPDQNNAFYANANHSSIFLQLVGKSEKLGTYKIYLLTDFTGNGKTGYGLRLKQAYATLGPVTAGLANSTFMDASVGTPGIDDRGPAGEIFIRNVLLRFNPHFGNHWSAAISIENPNVSYTTGDDAKKISPRCPDIPAYVQYEWNHGSHVRVSGLFRSLSYRNLVAQRNKSVTGWAAGISGRFRITPSFNLLYQGNFGRGYAAYVQDLSGNGLDLVHSSDGNMVAPRMYAFEVGATYNITPSVFLSSSYSKAARILGHDNLGPDAYRNGDYISATAFYDIIPDMRLGLGYLHGIRKDFDGESGHANRITAMIKYSF